MDTNQDAIGLMREIKNAYESDQTPIVISGNLGPRALVTVLTHA